MVSIAAKRILKLLAKSGKILQSPLWDVCRLVLCEILKHV